MLSDLCMNPRPEACVSDLIFDQWHAGELPLLAQAHAEAHVASCARCRARKRALLEGEEAFLQTFPSPRARAPRLKTARAWAMLATGIAAAAAILLVLRSPATSDGPPELGVRVKGSARLDFFIKRGELVFPGGEGQKVRAGDRLRFVATTARPLQLAILSRDGSGQASIYYPASARSQALGLVRQAPLDTAVELDATLGKETVFGVFCSAPFELEPVRLALEHTGALPALEGCTVDELTLLKEPGP